MVKPVEVVIKAKDEASGVLNSLGGNLEKVEQKTGAFPGALTKVAGAIAGAFAVDRVIEFGKSVNAVADEYKNFESKLRLAIGAQGDLQATVQGVGKVAQETNSNLDATGALFGRLAASGKELNITNAAALGITQSINQAIQISGASAQASEAAVRQLVQGLQSGVIRGDEFNSIMEQAPRLAQALADGLGVPIGALRGLAEQGQLTSAKVVAALKGQSEAINKEFATIPLTTGRALENLNTQWTLFIGKLTGGAQQSSVVAQGISLLANNLETLAAVAGRAGAVLTAALALQGVQALKAFSLEMATTGKAASLMSLELSKVPKVINITVAAVGLEVGFQIGEMLTENFALARQFGVGLVGFFQLLVNDLQLLKEAAAAVFTSDTVDAALDRYVERNKQIGESLKDMFTDAEKAPVKVAAAADAATGSVGSLGGAGSAAGQALAAGGAAGAAGVSQVGKAADDARGALSGLATAINAAKPVDAFKDIVQNLTAAKSRGVDLVKLLRDELPPAIDKLSGTELAKFRTEFIRAMDDAGIKGKALQEGLVLIGEQAAKSLGVDVVAASSKIGNEFVQANEKMRLLILSMPALKAAGIDTGQVVGEALAKMVDGTKNKAELDAVIARVQALRKELGDKVADGLLDQARLKAEQLNEVLEKAKPGIQSVREAMEKLGITSDKTLKDTAQTAKESYDFMVAKGTSSARELAEGFKKAAEDAIKANNGIAPSWVAVEAATRGYELQVDSAGKTTVRAMSEAKNAVDGVGQSVRDNTADLEKQAAVLDAINAKYGQSKADRDAKYGKVGGDPAKTSDGNEKNADGSTKGTFTNTLPVDIAFAVNAKNAAGKLTAADLADAKAGFSQAKKAKEDMDAFVKLAPGAASTAYIQSTNALFTASKLALEKVQAMTRSTLRAKVVAQSPVAAPTVPASSAEAPAPAPDTPPPIVQTPAQAQDTRLQAARAAYPNAQGSTPEEVIFNGTKSAGGAAIAGPPTPAPAPAPSTVTYTVRIEPINGPSSTINVSSEADAQALIRALQDARNNSGL